MSTPEKRGEGLEDQGRRFIPDLLRNPHLLGAGGKDQSRLEEGEIGEVTGTKTTGGQNQKESKRGKRTGLFVKPITPVEETGEVDASGLLDATKSAAACSCTKESFEKASSGGGRSWRSRRLGGAT